MKKAALLFFAFVFLGFGQTPSIRSVLNNGNYSAMLAAGQFISIFGSNLATSEALQTSLPLPLTLGGATVMVDGQTIPLTYASAGQINALLPFGITGYHSFVVTTSAGASPSVERLINSMAPSIYTANSAGTGQALVFDANFKPVTNVGADPVVLYASGLGPTNPAGTVNGGNTSEPFNRVTTQTRVSIGGQLATIIFEGLAPGFAGVYQINIQPPTGPLADNTLTLSTAQIVGGVAQVTQVGSVTSVPIATQPNAANVTGNIAPTYPLDGTALTFSPALTSAVFSVGFDVLPGASSFNVVASCPGGAMTIAVNPAAGTWTASGSVPTSAERSGDFSTAADSTGKLLRALDFRTGGLQFINNIVPQSRLDPVAVQAAANIPLPNSNGTAANFTVQGTIPPGGHFAVDSNNLSNLASFGNFAQLLYIATENTSTTVSRTNACYLTVDGKLVSSSLTSFQ